MSLIDMQNKKNKFKLNQRGFTMIELLASIGISVMTMYFATAAISKSTEFSQRSIADNEFLKTKNSLEQMLSFNGYCSRVFRNNIPIWTLVKSRSAVGINGTESVITPVLTDDQKKDFVKQFTSAPQISLNSVQIKLMLKPPSRPENILGYVTFVFDQTIQGSGEKKSVADTTVELPIIFQNFDSAASGQYSCHLDESMFYFSASQMCSSYGGSMENGLCRFPRIQRNAMDYSLKPDDIKKTVFNGGNAGETMTFADAICYLDNLTIRSKLLTYDEADPAGTDPNKYDHTRFTMYCQYPSRVMKGAQPNWKKLNQDVSKNVRAYFPNYEFVGDMEELNGQQKR